jgi:hypothetical protein
MNLFWPNSYQAVTNTRYIADREEDFGTSRQDLLLMRSRQTAYYGLLACLVALFALGLQPLRVGKWTAQERGNSEKAPAEEPADEEEEAEEESEEITPIRRKVLVWLHATGECRYVAAASCASPPQIFNSFAPRLCRELAARNGIGGPLRL